MKRVCLIFILSILVLFWAVSAKASYWTNAFASARIGGGDPQGQMDEHEASVFLENENGIATGAAAAQLYLLKAHGYAGVTQAIAHGYGESGFGDTYTVTAPEGVEFVRIGMRIGLSGMLEYEANIGDASFDVYVYLNEEQVIYDAYASLDNDGLYVSSSGSLTAEDFTQLESGGYELSDFTDTIYFLVPPGEFSISYTLYAGVNIGLMGMQMILGTGWAISDFYYSANFEIFPADENIISFTSESGQLAPVPIPSTLLLLGSGLLGLISMKKMYG